MFRPCLAPPWSLIRADSLSTTSRREWGERHQALTEWLAARGWGMTRPELARYLAARAPRVPRVHVTPFPQPRRVGPAALADTTETFIGLWAVALLEAGNALRIDGYLSSSGGSKSRTQGRHWPKLPDRINWPRLLTHAARNREFRESTHAVLLLGVTPRGLYDWSCTNAPPSVRGA